MLIVDWYVQEFLAGLVNVAWSALIFYVIRINLFRRYEWGTRKKFKIALAFGSLALVMPFIDLVLSNVFSNATFVSGFVGCAWAGIVFFSLGRPRLGEYG